MVFSFCEPKEASAVARGILKVLSLTLSSGGAQPTSGLKEGHRFVPRNAMRERGLFAPARPCLQCARLELLSLVTVRNACLVVRA